MDSALLRLGQLVRGRRLDLGYATLTDFCKPDGPLSLTPRVLSDVEGGRRRVGGASEALIETALAWEHGSFEAVLAGGVPKAIDVPIAPTVVRGVSPVLVQVALNHLLFGGDVNVAIDLLRTGLEAARNLTQSDVDLAARVEESASDDRA